MTVVAHAVSHGQWPSLLDGSLQLSTTNDLLLPLLERTSSSVVQRLETPFDPFESSLPLESELYVDGMAGSTGVSDTSTDDAAMGSFMSSDASSGSPTTSVQSNERPHRGKRQRTQRHRESDVARRSRMNEQLEQIRVLVYGASSKQRVDQVQLLRDCVQAMHTMRSKLRSSAVMGPAQYRTSVDGEFLEISEAAALLIGFDAEVLLNKPIGNAPLFGTGIPEEEAHKWSSLPDSERLGKGCLWRQYIRTPVPQSAGRIRRYVNGLSRAMFIDGKKKVRDELMVSRVILDSKGYAVYLVHTHVPR